MNCRKSHAISEFSNFIFSKTNFYKKNLFIFFLLIFEFIFMSNYLLSISNREIINFVCI